MTSSTTRPAAPSDAPRRATPARRPRARRAGARAAGLGALAAALLATAPSASSAASNCPTAKPKGAEVIRLGRGFGCAKGADLAGRTVRGGGYYKGQGFYCRWGQGGTRPVAVGGRTYFGGFCFRTRDEREVQFLARKR